MYHISKSHLYKIVNRELWKDVPDLCDFCDGNGEVDVMESVYPGEPHMALVGTRTCDCQLDK